ncbi:MAG: hypothetical protein H7246_08425 [Phycisphaerae bacterium]|nr:hypothetical protein [Saprospiraceae bacterium]
MENQKSPNHNEDLETSNGPDANVANDPGTKKRRRIPSPTNMVSSSEQFETDESEILDPEAEVTEEDLLLLGDPELDQDGGEDELLGNDQYLDDTDFDDDPLNEESGRRAGSGGDLDVPDDELDNAGSAMQQEDEENDYFGNLDEDEEAPEDDETKDVF